MTKEWVSQVQVVHWLRELHPQILFWYTPNESDCAVQYREKLKRMGALNGVSDLFFPQRAREFSGLVVEMKSLTGRMRKEQKAFFDKMRNLGYACITCNTAQAAIEYISWFYDL